MNRKSLVIFLATLVTANCYSYQSPVTNSHSMRHGQRNMAPNMVDSKVLGVMVAINKNEISAADLALSKSDQPSVKKFAEWMKTAHGKNLSAMESMSHKLSVPISSSKLSKTIQRKGQREMSLLRGLHGKEFNKSYMSAMVKGHEDALEILDNQIREAANPMLKRKLEHTRADVQHHLSKAKMIYQKLG